MNYELFSATSGIDGKTYECRFRYLMTGITPRHSDTTDVKFLVNGDPVVVALPQLALSNFRSSAGMLLTDPEVKEMAALMLKETIEKEGLSEDRMVVASQDKAMELARQVS
jgi:hypothetical protein